MIKNIKPKSKRYIQFVLPERFKNVPMIAPGCRDYIQGYLEGFYAKKNTRKERGKE